jgi:hypothetical protein
MLVGYACVSTVDQNLRVELSRQLLIAQRSVIGALAPLAAMLKPFWSVRSLGESGRCQTLGVLAVRAVGMFR